MMVEKERREGRSEKGSERLRKPSNKTSKTDQSVKSQVRKKKARARQAMEEKLASAMVKEVEAALATTRRSPRSRTARLRRGRGGEGSSWQQIPKSKEVSSTLQVLSQPATSGRTRSGNLNQETRSGNLNQEPRSGNLKQLGTKPKNTQLSAQLMVDLESPGGAEGQVAPWAVYEPQKVGNSPIYIAPGQYEVEDSRPYQFSGYTTRDSFNVPVASLVAGPTTTSSYNNNNNNNRYNRNNNGAIFNGPGTPVPTFATNTVATNAKGKENGDAYDPFYPNYKGFGRKASALQRPASPVVVVEKTRPYFPNYFPPKLGV